MTTIASYEIPGGGLIALVRSSMGQVAEYEVYEVGMMGRTYKGGGTKREARKVYDALVKASTPKES